MLYRDRDHEFLITHGCDYVVAHRLVDGAELWRCGGLNPKGRYNPTLRFVASPVAAEGLVVVPSREKRTGAGHLARCQRRHFRNARGTRLDTRRKHPRCAVPVVHDGLVYLCRENGVLICMDAKSGRELYQERTYSQRYRASPVYADGKVYLTARDGVVTVVKAGRTFEVLATNKLGDDKDAEAVSASPAISGGRIYLRPSTPCTPSAQSNLPPGDYSREAT